MWEDYSKKLKYYLSLLEDGSYEKIYYQLQKLIDMFIERKDEKVFEIIDQLLAGPPTAEGFNKILSEFKADSDILERIGDQTRIVSIHNTSTSIFNVLDSRISKVRDKILELSYMKSLRKRYVGSDTFSDLSKVDIGAIPSNESCAFDTTHGVVTLKKTSSANLKNNITNIEVTQTTDTLPKRNENSPLDDSGLNIFYEGQYYGIIGQAYPEGGRWRFKTATAAEFASRNIAFVGTITDTTTIPDKYAIYDDRLFIMINGKLYGVVKNSWGIIQDPIKELSWIDNSKSLSVSEILRRESGIVDYEGYLVVDEEATEEELKNVRMLMIDEDPLSYWQCEKCVKYDQYATDDTVTTTQEVSSKPGTELDDQSYIDNYGTLPTIDKGLSIQLIFTFDEKKNINWIGINPFNFPKLENENTPIHITNIEYDEFGNDDWKQIPGFNYLVLTDNLNQVVSDYTLGVIMEENKYAFKGKGIWSFETIPAKKIRISASQPRQYKLNYQNYLIQLASQQEISRGSNYTSVARTNTITLPYMNTVAICEGDLALETQVGETSPTNISSTRSSYSSGFLGIGASSSSTSYSLSSTGMYIVNKWLQTNQNPIGRYAIGIREINFSSYAFAQTSQFVSSSYTIPENIGEIELEVEDYIPSTFDENVRWIKYFIYINGEWHEISPSNKNYTGLPTRIRIGNSSHLSYEKLVADTDTKEVRIRIVMSRPNDVNSESPKLFSYKIITYPKE